MELFVIMKVIEEKESTMSQPIAWVASVKMQETAFKKMLRSTAIKEFAKVIEQTLFNNSPNYYIFRYLKKEGAVFAFFFFNHGNGTTLDEAMDWLPIKELAAYSEAEDAGYAFSTLDAINFNKVDIHHAYSIHHNLLEPLTELSDEVFKKLSKDVEKYFIKEIDKDFANNFYHGRIVDKSIVKKCKALAETRRIKNVLANLSTASFTKPLHIFDRYYYNGHSVYHQFGKCTILAEIDPQTFVQTSYGAADASHVVINGKVLAVNPKGFKKMQKMETCYYLNQEQVFDSQLMLIAEADAPSFKLVEEHYAIDAYAVYFCGQRLLKKQLGSYRFHTGGYFHVDKILLGEQAVYLGSNCLPVDAATFRIIENVERKQQGSYGHIIYVAEDQTGKMLIYTEFDKRGHYSHYILERTAQPAQALAAIEEQDQKQRLYQRSAYPPEVSGQKAEEEYEQFSNWLQVYFDEFYRDVNKTHLDMGFYYKLNNYFAVCFELQKYQEMLALYEKIKSIAWVNPYLFHHTACAFTALGKYECALQEVEKAVIYGYEKIQKIFVDSDLAPLHNNKVFIKLQEDDKTGKRSIASLQLLQSILTLSPEVYGVKAFVSNLAKIFYFPDVHQVQLYITGNKEELAEYEGTLQQVFDGYFFLYDEKYKTYESLHPKVHYLQLAQWYSEAHGYSSYIDYQKLLAVTEGIGLLKKSLANSRYAERNTAVYEELQDDTFFHYLLGF